MGDAMLDSEDELWVWTGQRDVARCMLYELRERPEPELEEPAPLGVADSTPTPPQPGRGVGETRGNRGAYIAWGLRRYGFKKEVALIAAGILDAARFSDGRLPEAFGGYEREMTKYPVQYPTACSPQAWSTGAPLLLLRTLLGLEPVGDQLVVDPALPPGLGHLKVLDIPRRWGRVDAFARERGSP